MNHTFTRRLLAVLVAMLCLIPAAAGALDESNILTNDSGTYSWDETRQVLTVTGDVTVEGHSADDPFTLVMESGSCEIQGGFKGKLDIRGGEVKIQGKFDYDVGSIGAVLTQDSTITGGSVTIIGGNSTYRPAHALSRENSDVTLTISNGSLLIKGGVYEVDQTPNDNPPKPKAAIADDNLDMLIWQSPVNMKAGEYDGDQDTYKNMNTVYMTADMAGKHVIQSFKGWKVTYDANGGTGSMDGAIVADGQPYTIETECGFAAPQGYSFAGSWLVNDEPAQGLTFPVTEDTTIKPVWKVDTIYLQLAFEDENGAAEISGWAYAYLDDSLIDDNNPTTFDQFDAGEHVITDFAELPGYKTPDDVVIYMYSNGTFDSLSDHASMTKNANGTWIVTIKLTKDTGDTGNAGGGSPDGEEEEEEEERFTVTFMDGDKLWKQTGAMAGETLPIVGMPVPSAPEGHAFAGWYTKDGVHVKHGMPVDRDIIAYAKWQPFSEQAVTVYTGDSIVMTVDAPEADYYEWAVDYGDGKGWRKLDNQTASHTISAADLSNSDHRYRCIAKKLGNALPQSCIFTLKVIDRNALPKTGDPSSLLGWAMLLGMSGVGAKALSRRKK